VVGDETGCVTLTASNGASLSNGPTRCLNLVGFLPADQIDLLAPGKAVAIHNFKVTVFRVNQSPCRCCNPCVGALTSPDARAGEHAAPGGPLGIDRSIEYRSSRRQP
jgi:hypothetical protein